MSQPEGFISIIMGSRSSSGGNSTSNLRDFLRSLRNASTPDNYEVLIKFDDDDPGLGEMLQLVAEHQEKGRERISLDTGESEGFDPGQNIRYIVTPRLRGYQDLDKAYNELLPLANPRATLYWNLSDDVILLGRAWDLYILEAAKKYADGIFVLCPSGLFTYRGMGDAEALERCENYPIWSKKILELMTFGPTFATDAWTNMVMRKLFYLHGVDRRIPVQQVYLHRRQGPQDFPGSERWNGVRKETHDYLLSPAPQKLLDEKVTAVVEYLHGK